MTMDHGLSKHDQLIFVGCSHVAPDNLLHVFIVLVRLNHLLEVLQGLGRKAIVDVAKA